MVAWRSYEAFQWVHPGVRTEFLLIYAGYPLALVGVESLALAFLYKRRNTGRILAAAVFGYAAFNAASQFWSDGAVAYADDLERAAGDVLVSLVAVGLSLLALSLIREHLREKRLAETKRTL